MDAIESLKSYLANVASVKKMIVFICVYDDFFALERLSSILLYVPNKWMNIYV